jgi:8-oxo-(d)GTP phosphatase
VGVRRVGGRGADDVPQQAAGGVLWRPDGSGGIELALVHRPRHDDWSLPKGKLRRDEHPLSAACREVNEETGHLPVVGRRLPTQTYLLVPLSALASTPDAGIGPARRRAAPGSGPTGRSKTVRFWAMRAADGPARPHDGEVDQVGWFASGAAERRLSYHSDRDVVRAFLTAPPDTVTLLLVPAAPDAHRWAGAARPWSPEATGRRRAARLRETLVWFGPRRVLTAPPDGCGRTVAPLAAALGVAVEADPRLAEDVHAARPEVTRDALRALVTDGESAVVCCPAGTVDALVRALSGEDGAPPADGGADGPPARAGGVWALSFHRGRLVAADHYADIP